MPNCNVCGRAPLGVCACGKTYCKLCLLTREACSSCGRAFGTCNNPFTTRLADIAPGVDEWQDYQQAVTDAFEELFVPPLEQPRSEVGTGDGARRRDSIFPNLKREGVWRVFYEDFDARVVVVEAKNGTRRLGAPDLHQMEAYLSGGALGNFGIICARKPPAPTAVSEQLRVLSQQRMLILILTDADIERMFWLAEQRLDPGAFLVERQLALSFKV